MNLLLPLMKINCFQCRFLWYGKIFFESSGIVKNDIINYWYSFFCSLITSFLNRPPFENIFFLDYFRFVSRLLAVSYKLVLFSSLLGFFLTLLSCFNCWECLFLRTANFEKKVSFHQKILPSKRIIMPAGDDVTHNNQPHLKSIKKLIRRTIKIIIRLNEPKLLVNGK